MERHLSGKDEGPAVAATPVSLPISSRPGFHEASSVALRIITEAPAEWPALAEEGYDPETVSRVSAWTRQRVRELASPELRALVFEELGIYVTRARMASLSSESHRRQEDAAAMAASKAARAAKSARRDVERALQGSLLATGQGSQPLGR